MNLKRRIIRTFLFGLPTDMKQVLANDFLDYLYADLSLADRQRKRAKSAPRLIDWISKGKAKKDAR